MTIFLFPNSSYHYKGVFTEFARTLIKSGRGSGKIGESRKDLLGGVFFSLSFFLRSFHFWSGVAVCFTIMVPND